MSSPLYNPIPKLQEIKEVLQNLSIDADTINLNTDELELLLQDQINQLQAILEDIDAINTKVSTTAKQDTGNTSLGSIDTKLTSIAKETTLGSVLSELELKGNLSETQPVSIASLPLPTGAATEVTLSSFSNKEATEVHQRIHQGNYWTCADNATINLNAIRNILIICGATKNAHFYFDIFAFNTAANKAFRVDLYEATTVSSNGTSIVPDALNRSNLLAPEATFFHTPTISSDGNVIMKTRTGKDRVSLIVREGEEYILNANTKYLLRITSLTNANDIQINMGIYEI